MHGTEQYFIERAASERRLSYLSVGLGAFLFGLVLIPSIPAFRGLRELPIMRFGLEGPTRFVQLVQVDAASGNLDPLQDVGHVRSVPKVAGEAGGAARPVPARRASARAARGPNFDDPGDAAKSLMAKALANQGGSLIFQSEDLVIEHLVRPEYPEQARDQGIEGRVQVLAHVDTLGSVVEAAVVTPSGTSQLDHAAERAVLQCRFRPYRIDGEAREVYAMFNFAFRIY